MAVLNATPVIRTVGTTGRDHSTVALWDAARGNPATDDTIEIAELYPDSVFTEGNTTFSAWSANEVQTVIIRAADGHAWAGIDGVAGHVKFATIVGFTTISGGNVTADSEFEGIEFAGDGGMEGFPERGLLHMKGDTHQIRRCSFHDNPIGPGHSHQAVSVGRSHTVVNCAFRNNAEDGTFGISAGSFVFFSVFHNNTGWAIGANNSVRRSRQFGCSFSSSGAGSVEFPEAQLSGYCIMDDQAITDDGAEGYEIIENATFVAGDFNDIANGDYTILAGSQLIKQGPLLIAGGIYTNTVQYREDGTGAAVISAGTASADQHDIGLHQLSYVAAPITNAPIVS